ncbi:flavodoxin-dependent (E)-4-hydroxy-3-methylbut-2-enyl-diphosphate synthase [Pseudomonas sp. PCH446]
MTNSDTNDVAATVAQINRLEAAGVDIVRISVPDMDAAEAFGRIKQLVKVPLVADIHFDYELPCAWPSWVSTACASTRAISVAKTACARWSTPP